MGAIAMLNLASIENMLTGNNLYGVTICWDYYHWMTHFKDKDKLERNI